MKKGEKRRKKKLGKRNLAREARERVREKEKKLVFLKV
jgi:hypothetical protein